MPEEGKKVNFIQGISTMGGAGGPALKVPTLLTFNYRMV